MSTVSVYCPCCSNLAYINCCGPFHTNKANPASPEAMMRSRYAAYVLHLIDYLVATTHAETRNLYRKKDIENWSKQNLWLKLEIISAAKDKVEFKAYYQHDSKNFIHHENSTFKMENKRWYYLSGEYFN